ncbi:MAG: methyltransferase domain-containing protein [Variovorax sp.]|nr:MAG: methyltransferase domain-containing protein [Variovorax sp.]
MDSAQPAAPDAPAGPAVGDDAFAHARTHFIEGLAALEVGRVEDAEHSFVASLTHVPGHISTLINLAATRLALGRPEGAIEAAAQVLAAEPDNAEAWFHHATALGQLGRHAEALAGWDAALKAGGPAGPIWLRHGQTLQALDRPLPALASYDRAVEADPTLVQAWTNRGNILREMHRLGEAAEAFREALAQGGDPDLHGYYLASLGAHVAPSAAPAAYVQTLFDDYAAQFDAHLVGTLHYSAHLTLTEPLGTLGRVPYASALDLGCGTGLCGPRVKRIARRLDGVDLSAGMLARADALGVYDTLTQADIVAHLTALAETSARHDLVLAADLFIYIGDLAPVFAGVRRVIAPRGVFCFSAELADNDKQDFQLLNSLRFAHSERYLHALAARHGFEVLRADQAPIREEQRMSIPGIFMYLTPLGTAD